ncbi:MAG: carboxypeptidase regulatory-like domain-containing protein [Bacteroidales bacterium]|nr:carboxypeptidase regulatory-like domain-containing protein [Bacteroidales bacterium]
MKNVKLLFLAVFAFMAFGAMAQNPVLSWRFANAQVIPGDSARFDVELKCDMPGTFHSSTQVYFNFNTAAFGENIAGTPPTYADRKIRWEKLALLNGDVAGSPKYNVVNAANNKPYRFAIIIEAQFTVANSMFMNEVTTDWQGYMRYTIAISDMNELAGIEFVDEDGGVGLMNGGQYYVDATHPNETKYGNPPDYAGIYENDLLTWAFIQPGNISGTVTDFVSGLGIANASVSTGTYSTTTAADGTYTLQVNAGTYDVTATADCHDPYTHNGVVVTAGNTTTLDFALTGSEFGIVEGTVTDAITLLPIDGATVTMGAYSTTTNATGFYQIVDVVPGTYDIDFTHPDYLDASVNGVMIVCNATTTVDVTMVPTSSIGTIDGTVTDLSTNNPIENVLIQAGAYSTLTLADGTYSFDLPAGTYDVSATILCYAPATQPGVVVPMGGTITVDFALDPQALGTLEGYVLDEVTQLGIENASVTFGTFSATTNASGFYSLDNVDEGTYDVTATHPDYNTNTVTGVVVTCGQTTQQDIELYPLVPPLPVLSWQFANYDVVNDSLVFDVQLKCSIPGTYHSSTQIYFDYNTDAFGQSIKANNKITYERLQLLQGDVTGTDKYAIVNATDNTPSRFAIVFEANFVIADPNFMNEVTTDWQGFMRFKIKISDNINNAGVAFVPSVGTIGLMNGGQYYVDQWHPMETKYGVPPLYEGNYINDLLNFPLYTSGTLTGVVLNANTGLGIVGATVEVAGFSTQTVGGGSYTLVAPTGTWDATASAPCFTPQTVSVTIVQGAPTIQNFSLTPDPIGTVEGVVTSSTSGAPIVGATVQIGSVQTTTVAGGAYTLDIAAGTYTANVTAAGFEPLTVPGITVVCQQTVTYNFQMTPSVGTIAGTITNCTGGAGIQGAVVTTTPGNYTGTTAANGSYTIGNVPPGTYTLDIVASGYFDGQVAGVVVNGGQTTTANACLDAVTPPANLTAEVQCTTVNLEWDAPGAGPGTILCVDRDGSSSITGYTDDWTAIKAALDANGYAYDYHEVTDLTQNGPPLTTLQDYDIVIWFTGEGWQSGQTMGSGDEANLAAYLNGGGSLILSGQDYLYDKYPSAGNFNAGQFPRDYLGLTSVSQDLWIIETTPGSANGAAGSCAAGISFQMQDIYSVAKEGLYIDQITHLGDDLFQVTNPTPAGIAACQYEGSNFKSIFTTISLAAVVDPADLADIMAGFIGWASSDAGDDLNNYKVYRDGTLLASPATTSYTDNNVTPGQHEYCVTAVYDEGESQSVCVTVTTELCLPPSNLYETYPGTGLTVPLFWDEPNASGEWIGWFDPTSAGGNGIGLTAAGSFYIASHWLPADLTPYGGQFLKKINFWWNDDAPEATFEIYVWKGPNAGTQLLMQTVTGGTPGGFNEVTLTTPVQIDASAELWFGYKVTHGTGTHPAGTDLGPAIANKGDMLSMNGTAWESMSIAYGLSYNWAIEAMVSAVAEGAPAQPMVNTMEIIENPGTINNRITPNFTPGSAYKATLVFENYNVYRKNLPSGSYEVVGQPTVPEFEDVAPDYGVYSYYVTAVYTNGESPASNVIEVDLIDAVNEITVSSIVVYPNPATDLVNIQSDLPMSRIIVINSQGQIVYEKDDVNDVRYQINTGTFQTGVYYLKLETEKGWVDKKVIIK